MLVGTTSKSNERTFGKTLMMGR